MYGLTIAFMAHKEQCADDKADQKHEFQWFDGAGIPLTTLKLLQPLTIHFRLRAGQQALLVKGQVVYTLWNAVQGSVTALAMTTQATTRAMQAAVEPQTVSTSSTLMHAAGDPSGMDWSVQTHLSTTSSPTGATPQSRTQSPALVASPASTVAFGTQAPQATWGKPTVTQVSLNSGGLTYNYPLDTPAGPGGLKPSLALNYSSGAVNENHGWQSVSDWVGQGWDLDMGSITWGEENVTPNGSATLENVWHINDPSGIGGQLIPPDLNYTTHGTDNPTPSQLHSGVTIWRTAPYSAAKVQEYSPDGSIQCWRVYLPNGIMEEFGCTSNSQITYADSTGTWDTSAWKLDLITDRYGNQVHISYQERNGSAAIHDLQPLDVTYDDISCHSTSTSCSSWHPQVDIHFDASPTATRLLSGNCGSWSSSITRCDDPVDLSGSGGLPSPQVVNEYLLNDVQVQVGGQLLREYLFSYNQGGPSTQTDPNTNKKESAAGYLTLGKIQEAGTNGTTLNEPLVTASYTQEWQHYSDLISYSANNGAVCSPYSNAPRDGSSSGPCYLWSQSFNQYYLTNLDNGEGWHETVSWKEAHSNTWGTDGGTSVSNAFQCSTSQTSTNICGRADDKNWSREVVSSRTTSTNGVSATWSYGYSLQTGVKASIPGTESRSCTGSCASYDWGNQNDDDDADYYNGDFQSFTQTKVTLPNGSTQTNTYVGTNGWGLYSTGITCYSGGTCYAAPYNASGGPVLSGKQNKEQDFDSSGHLLKEIDWTWSTNCPPAGVSGSVHAAGGSSDPGTGFLFSELDHNNPIMVCDPRSTQQDTYLVDGVSSSITDSRVVHTTTKTSYDGNTCGTTGRDYQNVSQTDETANDASGHLVSTTLFCPNDALTSSGGVFLTNMPAQSQTLDSPGGTSYGCTQNLYGSNTSVTSAPSVPSVSSSKAFSSYNGGCSGSAVTLSHTYDAWGNGLTNTDGDGHLGCTIGSTQYSACASYESREMHLVTATNAKNQVTTYSYDPDAPEAGFGEWLMSETDPNGLVTSYEYDALGRLTAIIRPGDSSSSPTVSYTYNNGCSAGTTTPCIEIDTATRFTVGGPTSISKQWFDGLGNQVETQTPGPNLFSKVPAIPSELVSYIVYDNMGNPTTKSLTYAVAATAGLGYVAPDLNQPRTVTGYDGLERSLGTITYSNATTIVQKATLSYTVAQGVSTISSQSSTPYEQRITLDAYNHQSITYMDGFGRTRYSQIFSGTASPYAVVRTVATTHDPAGNTLSVLTSDHTGTVQASYTASYTGLQQLLGSNDSDLGSCAEIPLPGDCSNSTDLAWKYTYDADGNQLSQTDPRNTTHYTTYDALDRPLCTALNATDASSCGGTTYAVTFYDDYSGTSTPGATLPAGCVAPTGAYASYPLGQKTGELFVGTSGAGNGWRCYGYDARGKLDQSTLSVTTPDAGTVTQTVNMLYNDGGNLTTLVYPDGETLTSTYDLSGRLHSLYFGTPSTTDPVTFLVGQMTYANDGQTAGMALGGSGPKASVPTPILKTSTTYDGIQRPLSDSVSAGSTTLWSQTRAYDNNGNVLGLSTVVPTQSGPAATENESFCYDALNRMVWAGNSGTPTGGDHCMTAPTGTTLTTYSQSVSYDDLDRMLSGSAGTYTYGSANPYHAVTGLSSVPNQYATYDPMGNMLCRNTDASGGKTCAGGSPTGATMSYDAQGQLATWNAPSGTVGTANYLYDNEGSRVLTHATNASATTNTIYFDGYTDTVLSGGTTTTTKYYNVNGQRVAVRTGSTFSYLASDSLGSNTVAFNSSGQVIAFQHYSPYGTMDYTWGSMPTTYNYAGERLDSQTGLLYDNFRYYDPVSGRYVRSDNVQDNSSGMDPYAYVGDNPETRNDPTGHCWPLCTMIIGALVGAAINVATTVVTDAVQHKTPTLGEIAQSAAVGAVSGAVAGLVGPEAGPLVKAAVGGLAAGAGQLTSNALSGKPLMDGVASATVVGAVTGGLVEGAGSLLKGASSEIGEVGDGLVSDAESACGLSFAGTTPITTPGGTKPISSLEVGQKVTAYDPTTKTVSTQTVQHIFIDHDTDLIDVTLAVAVTTKNGASTKTKQVAVSSHGSHAPPSSTPTTTEVVHTTQSHPWLTTKGWVTAGSLHLGDHVQQLDGSTATIVALAIVPGAAYMYDLTVSNVHTFGVGNAQFVVHNCGGDLPEGEPPNDWQHDDLGVDNQGASYFDRSDAQGRLSATLDHNKKTLTIEWMDSLSSAKKNLPPLVNWLGDRVQTVQGLITDNFLEHYQQNGPAPLIRTFSNLPGDGFSLPTFVTDGVRNWISFSRMR